MNDVDATAGMVKSDQTLLAILEALHENDRLGVTELAETTGVSKSAVHKHLKTLENANYVVNEDGTYRLGFKFFTYGAGVRLRSELCQLLQEQTDELVERTGEMGVASIEEHGKGTYIAIENFNLTQASNLGTRYHLNISASGKAILSQFSREEIDAIIDRYGLPKRTENTITTREELFAEVERIRERNYATNFEELREGLSAVAVPVQHPETGEIGSLAISGPTHRFTEETIENEYADILLESVNELELQMNYG